MTIIPFAEWCPDMPDLSEMTDVASNVIPRTPESYGPFSALASYSSNALDGQCIGMIAVQDTSDSVFVFAGTSDKLYQADGGSAAWSDVSQAGGYATEQGDSWHFAQFKTLVIGTNFEDAMQSYTLGSSTAFGNLFTAPAWATSTVYSVVGEYVLANGARYQLTVAGTSASTGTGPSGTGTAITDGTCTWSYQSSAPPQARQIAIAKNFCIVANTSDPVGGTNPARVWWSVNGDPTTWPVPGSDQAQAGQSDYNDIVGQLGDITGLAPNLAGCDCAVFFARGVQRMVYAGPPDVFDFFPAENVRGCRAPNSIVPLGAIVYYLADDGFYAFDGNVSEPIGLNKVDKWFYSQVNQSFLWNVIGAADVINKAIVWIYPSAASSSGVPDSAVVYRWDIQRWAPAEFPADWITRLLTFGATLDSLSSLGFTDLDTLPYSLDSRVWIGGALTLGGVDNSHKLAFFNGSNLEAQIATKAMQIIPNRRAFVQSARPLVDGGALSVAISARVNYYDPEVFGPDVAVNAAGECPQRSDGRYHRARVTVPAGASWAQGFGVDLTAIPAGVR